MDLIGKLVKNGLVVGLPKLKYTKDRICDACQKNKQVKAFSEPKNIILFH